VTQNRHRSNHSAAGFSWRRLRSRHQAGEALMMIAAMASGFDAQTAWLPLLSTTVAPARFDMKC